MSFTKTRIWRGGVQNEPPPGEQTPRTLDADAVTPPQGILIPFERPTPSAPVETAQDLGHYEVTRAWPIEQLLAEAASEAPASAEGEATSAAALDQARPSAPPSIWRRLRTHATSVDTKAARHDRWVRVAIATLVTALALFMALDLLRPSPSGAPQTQAASDERAEASEGSDAPAEAHAEALEAQRSATPLEMGSRRTNPAPALPAGRERAAVDALITGDLERAERLYTELAKADPEQPAFSEVLRILESRTGR